MLIKKFFFIVSVYFNCYYYILEAKSHSSRFVSSLFILNSSLKKLHPW